MNVLIRSAGYLASVQDLGRTGFRQSGVSVGGALDWHGLRVANAVAGNNDDAAGRGVTLGRLRLRFEDERVVAWSGGAFMARIGDVDLPPGHRAYVGKDDELTMVAPDSGGRAWLAISGGIDVPLVLGSRSTDLRGNFGGHEGRALHDGDELALSVKERRFKIADEERRRFQIAAPWGAPAIWTVIENQNPVLRIVRGTDWERFTEQAQQSLLTNAFTVTSDSDRMGARLEGPELQRCDGRDLLSESVA